MNPGLVTSLNPLSLEGTTMVPSSFIHPLRSLIRRAKLGSTASPTHPEAEAPLSLPRCVDGPAAAAQLARDLLRGRRDDVTQALYLNDRHRLVGSMTLAVGWVQAARLAGVLPSHRRSL
jgi:hypothetical protein